MVVVGLLPCTSTLHSTMCAKRLTRKPIRAASHRCPRRLSHTSCGFVCEAIQLSVVALDPGAVPLLRLEFCRHMHGNHVFERVQHRAIIFQNYGLSQDGLTRAMYISVRYCEMELLSDAYPACIQRDTCIILDLQ